MTLEVYKKSKWAPIANSQQEADYAWSMAKAADVAMACQLEEVDAKIGVWCNSLVAASQPEEVVFFTWNGFPIKMMYYSEQLSESSSEWAGENEAFVIKPLMILAADFMTAVYYGDNQINITTLSGGIIIEKVEGTEFHFKIVNTLAPLN